MDSDTKYNREKGWAGVEGWGVGGHQVINRGILKPAHIASTNSETAGIHEKQTITSVGNNGVRV